MNYAAILDGLAGRKLGDLGATLAAQMVESFPGAGITNNLRLAHFLAQVAEETGGFRWLTELGGEEYFAKYDGRLGNTQPGDGYRFRGRGLVMLTGRANYEKYGRAVGVDLIAAPAVAAAPATAVKIACAYWSDHGCNTDADKDDLLLVTHAINGGVNGLDMRRAYLVKAKAMIAAQSETTKPSIIPQAAVATGGAAVVSIIVAGATMHTAVLDLRPLFDGVVYPLLVAVLAPLVSGFAVIALRRIAAVAHITVSAHQGAVVEAAIQNGIGLALGRAKDAADANIGAVAVKSQIVADAYAYAAPKVPQALAQLGITPVGLQERIEARLAPMLAAPAAQTVTGS